MGIISTSHDYVGAKGSSTAVHDKTPVKSTGGIIKTTMKHTVAKRGDSFYSETAPKGSRPISTTVNLV